MVLGARNILLGVGKFLAPSGKCPSYGFPSRILGYGDRTFMGTRSLMA